MLTPSTVFFQEKESTGYNTEIPQSAQNPHGSHEITLEKVTSHGEIFYWKHPRQSCILGEITEEAQPLTRGKGSANHQIDKLLLLQRKTDYFSPPVHGFTKPPAAQSSKLLDLTPHSSNEGFNFSLLSSQQERALGLMWATMFSQKPFCFCLIPGTFPRTCPSTPHPSPWYFRLFFCPSSCLAGWCSAITSTHSPGFLSSLPGPASNPPLSLWYIDCLKGEALCTNEEIVPNHPERLKENTLYKERKKEEKNQKVRGTKKCSRTTQRQWRHRMNFYKIKLNL